MRGSWWHGEWHELQARINVYGTDGGAGGVDFWADLKVMCSLQPLLPLLTLFLVNMDYHGTLEIMCSLAPVVSLNLTFSLFVLKVSWLHYCIFL
jgi:hypothetical protein